MHLAKKRQTEIIHRDRAMRDYQAVYREFSVEKLEREVLQGSLADGANACVECCDRWAGGNRVALE
jgi:acetyl-CoA synthetase